MSIEDGDNDLKKISFEFGDRVFKFAVNPENYSFNQPHRTTAVKTKSRVVVQDFQSDIPTISIKGTTGYNPTGDKSDRGIVKIKEMKKFLEEYSEQGGNGDKPSEEFIFNNHTNNEFYVVTLSPEGISFKQDSSSPLLFKYEINLTVLRDAGDPNSDFIEVPEIGNNRPSLYYTKWGKKMGNIAGLNRFNISSDVYDIYDDWGQEVPGLNRFNISSDVYNIYDDWTGQKTPGLNRFNISSDVYDIYKDWGAMVPGLNRFNISSDVYNIYDDWSADDVPGLNRFNISSDVYDIYDDLPGEDIPGLNRFNISSDVYNIYDDWNERVSGLNNPSYPYSDAVNPQSPSTTSYKYGKDGISSLIGYRGNR